MVQNHKQSKANPTKTSTKRLKSTLNTDSNSTNDSKKQKLISRNLKRQLDKTETCSNRDSIANDELETQTRPPKRILNSLVHNNNFKLEDEFEIDYNMDNLSTTTKSELSCDLLDEAINYTIGGK